MVGSQYIDPGVIAWQTKVKGVKNRPPRSPAAGVPADGRGLHVGSLVGHGALGGLEGVEFAATHLEIPLHMGGEGTGPLGPLDARFRKGYAVLPGRELHDPLALTALLHNHVAMATVVRATVLLHENALHAVLDGITLHLKDLPTIVTGRDLLRAVL
jgi:hypothetical protein